MINYLIIERLSIITPNNKMKHTLKTLLLLFSAAITISMALLSCDSYERKMARFEKVADKFKATLGPNNRIIAEQIDSVAQKVFYTVVLDSITYPKGIMVHDYATGETKMILPDSHRVEDYEDQCIWKIETKVVKDRLFLKTVSSCMEHVESTGIFYINVRDNTLHYIESCGGAEFLENGDIVINKVYYLGEEDGWSKTKEEQYTLSTSLSDEAYADNRWEQKRKEERLAEEWRNRQIERRIYVSFNENDYRRPINIIMEGCSGIISFRDTWMQPGYCNYNTANITVPDGKIWVYNKRYSKGINKFSLLHMDDPTSSSYYSEDFTRDGTYIIRGGQTFRIGFNRSCSNPEETCYIDVYFTEKKH